MKNVFVDTNILIDLLADRRPFSKFAIEIFDLADKKKINLFTSSHSIATTHYILKKYIEEQELRNVLYSLSHYVGIASIDVSIIKKSLLSRPRGRHPNICSPFYRQYRFYCNAKYKGF